MPSLEGSSMGEVFSWMEETWEGFRVRGYSHVTKMYDDKGGYSVLLDQEKRDGTWERAQYGSPVAVLLHTRLLGTASVICTILPAIYLCHQYFT